MVTAPGDYLHFKANVPVLHISIGMKQWRYYDYGPKEMPPLVCLSGIAGTADVFYKQILSLSMKGYRVIAADAPPVWSHQEWVDSFEKFLDDIDVHHVHLYGTSLGGFLAQLYVQYRPRRVKSVVLSNSFLETCCFGDAMPWSFLVNWTPCFMLKRYILIGIRAGPYEPFIADSVDFVVSKVTLTVKVSKFKFLKLLEDGTLRINLHEVRCGHTWQEGQPIIDVFLKALETFQKEFNDKVEKEADVPGMLSVEDFTKDERDAAEALMGLKNLVQEDRGSNT